MERNDAEREVGSVIRRNCTLSLLRRGKVNLSRVIGPYLGPPPWAEFEVLG